MGYGYALCFTPQEGGVRQIYYGIDDPDPKIDTGSNSSVLDPLTNEPIPNYQVVGRISDGEHIIYAKYIDREGNSSPVARLTIDNKPFRVLTSSLPSELGATTLDINIEFEAKNHKKFRYLYSIDQEEEKKEATGERFLLRNLTRNPHKIFVQAIDQENQKTTPIYEFQLAVN